MKNVLFVVLVLCAVVVAGIAGDITANGMNQGDLYTFLSNVVTGGNSIKSEFNTLQPHLYNRALDSAGIASLPGATIQTTGFDYTINGLAYTQASASLAVTSTTEVSSGTFNIFVFAISATGTIGVSAGTAGTTAAAVVWPTTINPAHAPFGYMLVKAKSGATFTLGTDEMGADCDITQFNNLILVASSSNYNVATVSASDLSLTGL